MNSTMLKMACTLLAATVAFAAVSAEARSRKNSHRATTNSMAVDAWGTPIIMKGFHEGSARAAPPADTGKRTGPQNIRVVPQVSSPVTVPPPYVSPRDQPPRQLVQTPPPTYTPPKINTFSDRVTSCIHSYPLNAGIGNNPVNQNAYMGQCVNQ